MKLILCTVLLSAVVLACNGATIEGRSERHKRELCRWFGNMACNAMCKLKGRGSTQGMCNMGQCVCLLPNGYGGTGVVYPNGGGSNGIGFGGTNGFGGTTGFGGTNGIGFGGGTNGIGGGTNGFGYGYSSPNGLGYGGANGYGNSNTVRI